MITRARARLTRFASARLGLAAAALLIAVGTGGAARAADTSFSWRGLLDLVAANKNDEALEYNFLMYGDTEFDAYRLKLFAEGRAANRLEFYVQASFDEVAGVRTRGAYALFTPDPSRDLHLMAGKIPWIVGTWAPRTYSNHNPLMGLPLMYYYHTTLRWDQLPSSADALLAQSGEGSSGVTYDGGQALRGMPMVYDQCWDFGIALTGSQSPLEYAIGLSNGTPGHSNPDRDDNNGKTVLGRLGLAPTPAFRVGVSGAYGPYLSNQLKPSLPAGHEVDDYHQKLAMADLEWLAGHAELRAEGFVNAWETPTLGELRVHGGYAEGKYTLPAGFYLAGRIDAMRFGEIADSTGARQPWDRNIDRIEAGAGYRLTRGATAKLVYQRTSYTPSDSPGEREHLQLIAAQLSIAF